ncbi:MAG: sigma-70 family RNA polymerase sigma factor [Bacteroidales bacterium]|jgi:RNA polymerase sigma-70 factor (ECF subfamily)|nr:sigma-70 family RNA polymerase sigma factor [Bacteroidales bacterium]
MATAILNDDDLANDAVQETFVRLWRIRWRLGLMKDPQGFCIRSLRNCCIDMLRRDKQQQIIMYAKTSEAQIQQYDNDPNDTEQRYQQLEQALARLPQQQQTIIEMKYVKLMNIHEIAQQTGLSETNITTQLSRAYATLRTEMSKQTTL